MDMEIGAGMALVEQVETQGDDALCRHDLRASWCALCQGDTSHPRLLPYLAREFLGGED